MALPFWPKFRAGGVSRQSQHRVLGVQNLEERAMPAAPIIDVIANQSLTSNQTVRQIAIPASDGDGDTLTYSVKAAGTEAYFLSTDLSLKLAPRPINWGGQGERWFFGKGTYYYLTPAGEFHQWAGVNRVASGALLTTIAPAFFQYPDLLTRVTDVDLASMLDKRFGLTPTGIPSANTLGLNEQWMTGNARTRFFITPTGEVYQAFGTTPSARRQLVAKLDPAYARDIRLLTESRTSKLPVQLTGNVATIGSFSGAAGEFTVQVRASDATSTAKRTFSVQIVNDSVPTLQDPGALVLGDGESSVRVPLTSGDANGDSLTTKVKVAGSEAYFYATDLQLRIGSRPLNWGGEGEKWFIGRDGWYFLKPSGDFHRWDGSNKLASGEKLTTLQPAFFEYTDLFVRPQDEDLAYLLDRRLGLSPTISPAENSLGLGERWFKGKEGNFFITPVGDLYRQGKDSALIANFNAIYFQELNRLYAARPDRFSATVKDGVLTINTTPSYFGRFVAKVTVGDGLNATSRLIPVEQRFIPNPVGSATSEPPRVSSALSIGNRKVIVTFTRAMSNSALDPMNYGIVQSVVNPQAGGLIVTGARFIDEARDSVELTTLSQSSVTYTVSVVNVRDLSGKQIAARTGSGTSVDPSKADFAGSGPSGAERVDTDADGLSDDQEQNGWELQVRLVNGRIITRGVTSDPFNADTDGDGLLDAQEANLRLDPRDSDTDDDQLNDNQEFNEVFSDPTSQDSDKDGLDDNVEFSFFKTSPNQTDTDGDQIPDGSEVLLGNRKARVADLPAPSLRISDTRIGLDVRFSEVTSTGTRQLDSKNVTSTLSQSDSRSFSNTDETALELASKVSAEVGFEITGEFGNTGASVTVKNSQKFGTEVSSSGRWTTSNTEASSKATEQSYSDSLTTDKERTQGSELQRSVDGASLQASVFLRNIGNIGYRLKNLQITASIQDPQDPTKFSPVATMVPDAEPADGYTIGPLGADKGPIVFSNTTIYPELAESLMKNPRGLVYQFSNYDIIDEFGRNFAFTARDVVDRTSPLVIDFGGFDSDGDGEGDFTEYRRVSTSGGRVIDTNGDNKIDSQDHRVLFDAKGQEVGITLRESLAAIGLTHYDESTTPSDSLTEAQLRNSYSTKQVNGLESIYRIRSTSITPGSNKSWQVITRTGIDRTLDLDSVIMTSDSGARLAFVQDIDGDGLPANIEFINGTSDKLKDTDSDNLDDRFETLIGWDVEITPKGSKHVYSKPTLADSDRDGINDDIEAPSVPFDRNQDGLPDEYRSSGINDLVSDPSQADTDGDGISDKTEIDGYFITLYQTPEDKANNVTPTVIFRKTDPTNIDTDGDTAPDGVESQLGGDPTDNTDSDKFSDSDRDGLVNVVEQDGWDITVYGVSTIGFREAASSTVHVTSDPNNPDTDGDGLADGAEYRQYYNPSGQPGGLISVRTNPRSGDTDGDGLGDKVEALGFNLRDLGVVILDPRDADTDNDRLSDGEEAELQDVETKRWIVRVPDKDPYRVFSDPRQADQDFDGLVDGEEKYVFTGNTRSRNRMSDPIKANTDGDTRNDREDVLAGLDPLEEDFKVTVTFRDMVVKQDGDEGSSKGEIAFDFGVRQSDNTSVDGLSTNFTSVLRERWELLGALDSQYSDTSQVEPLLNVPDEGIGIAMQSGDSLSFAGVVPTANRSVTFTMTRRKKFSIEGVVAEIDNIDLRSDRKHGRNDNVSYVYMGGVDGVRADTTDGQKKITVFDGEELIGQVGKIQELTFDTAASDCIQGVDNTSNEPVSVKVRMSYLVS